MTFLPLPMLAAAAFFDLSERRIPNWITYSTALSALALHVITGQLNGFINSFSGLILTFLIFGVLPGLRVGGGDLKLAAAIGAWVGIDRVLWFVFYTLIAILITAVAATWMQEGAKGMGKRLWIEIRTFGAANLPLVEIPAAPLMFAAYLLLIFK